MDNTHNMNTRSKSKLDENIPIEFDSSDDSDSSVDENGNLKGFIDYDCKEDFDQKEFQNVLSDLRRKPKKSKKKKPKKIIKKHNKKDKKINDMFMTYLIMKATEKANIELKQNRKNKSKIKIEESDNESLEEISLDDKPSENVNLTILNSNFSDDLGDSDDSSFDSDTPSDKMELENIELESIEAIEDSVDDDSVDDDSVEGGSVVSEISETSEETSVISLVSDKESDKESEEDFAYEYDILDEKYEELIDNHMLKDSEESNMEYYHYLDNDKKEKLLGLTKEIYEYNGSNTPLRFKVIESEMDMKTKSIALENIDKMSEMDVSTGEHSKLDHWINGLMKIPFGKYNNLSINNSTDIKEKRNFITETYKTLDGAIYGHKEAKTHILQVIGKWIKNP